jgi:uncharacterized membrane protein
MLSLIAAAAFFLLIHFGVSGTRLRDSLVATLGAGPYRGLFSLASLGGIVWLVYAYRNAPTVETWGVLTGLRPAALVVVFIGVLLVVIGLASPNPTSVGMEGTLAKGADAVHGITRITRHPFLWGTALWALAHLVVNGDLASLILFGALLLLSVGGTASIDAKKRRQLGESWQQFAATSSNIPFGAIVSGRNALGAALAEIGAVRLLIAVAVYAAIFWLHGRYIAPLT